MSKRCWRVRGETNQHEIRVVHGWLSGRRRIFVNDALVLDDHHVIDGGSRHTFELDGREVELAISSPNGLTFMLRLFVDGDEVEPAPYPTRLGAIGDTVPISVDARPPPNAQAPKVRSRFISFGDWRRGER